MDRQPSDNPITVKVVYFGITAAACAGEETLSLPAAATVRELIATLVQRHGEAFRESLFWEDGEPLPYVTLLLDGRDVFHERGLDTPITAGSAAQFVLMPAAMGGG